MARLIDKLVGHRDTLEPLLKAHAQTKLASTLLFTGASGIGKRLAAQALAQTLVCEKVEDGGTRACGQCGPCVRVEKEQSESVIFVQPDGASVKIEQARDILQFISLQKIGRARVVIVDQAHLMNPQAANALLKSLEEPPAGTHFILITWNAPAVLPTIRSRSQLVRFRPLAKAELKKILETELGAKADEWLLEGAHGSVETAQRLTESRDDYLELEEATASYLSRGRHQFPGEEINRLRELTKDKSAQAFFSSLVQSVLRDSLRLQAGLEASSTRGEPWLSISSAMFGISPRGLSHLAEQALTMENDMARNVDRGLILENFAIEWRKAGQWDGSTSTRI